MNDILKQTGWLKGILAGLILCAFTLPAKEKITIYLIGDSTVCTQPVSQAPVTGWGTPFASFFDSLVTVENHARGGRSTRTFIEEQRWHTVANAIKPGDYVIMQFGHNDEAKEAIYRERYTSPEDYRQNLEKFITETRARQAIPILVTPVSRMKFDKNGKAEETHVAYSKVVKELGLAKKVPVIDLDTRSRQLYDSFGPEYARLLFNDSPAGTTPQFPAGIRDNTHFSEYGARKIAGLALDEMKRLDLDLLQYLVKP